VELLRRADVVAYDRLIHPDVLKLAPQARLIDVGKQPGASVEGQLRINDVLIDEAKQGNVVVRLKGGDPFVFGRGGEEARLLADAGITYEVVPGITSAIAAPAYAGIPLTHREHASWAVIATGHEDPTKPGSTIDWDAVARAPSAVFLMGVERIEQITTEMQRAGKAPDTPVAVVASATLPTQRVVRSTLEHVAADITAAGIVPPAVLVVGETVPLGPLLDWAAARPLNGKRIFVTRTRAQAGTLSALLREAGADAIEVPAIAITAPSDHRQLDAALDDPSRFGWILFTSVNAVASVFDRLRPRDARALSGVRIGAVGRATAQALSERGISADLVPATFTSEALASELGRPSGAATTVLLPQAEDAPPQLEHALVANGWTVTVAPAYRTTIDETSVERGREVLSDGVDLVLFTSASTVTNFVKLWGMPPAACKVVAIGPRTAEAAQALGVVVDAIASEPSIDALVNAAVSAVGR
jgi:uroporphyrinogen III methyltransferase/synthase